MIATPGYVYLIAGPDGLFKIGQSVNPLQRMSNLGGSAAGLALISHIATGDMTWLERYLHQAFSHRRVRREWFRLTAQEVAATMLTTSPPPSPPNGP